MKRVFVLLAVAGFALALLFFLSTKTRLGFLYSVGRGCGCSFRDAIASGSYGNDLSRREDEINRRSRVVQLDGALKLLETPDGNWWVDRTDHVLGFLLSEQEHDIYGTGPAGVQSGDVVLDCGANVGVFTRKALERGASKVIAIEPSPTALECLRRNLSSEISAQRVVVYPKGVWNRPDSLEMATVTQGNPAANSVVFGRRANSKFRIPVTTVDAIVDELRLERVDFIKMDIEGAEKEALAGAAGTIRKFHPRMALSSEHFRDDYKAIPQLVESLAPGYHVRATDCQDHYWRIQPEVLLFQTEETAANR